MHFCLFDAIVMVHFKPVANFHLRRKDCKQISSHPTPSNHFTALPTQHLNSAPLSALRTSENASGSDFRDILHDTLEVQL